MLASDISNRIIALAQENNENRFNILLNLIEAERKRNPVTSRQILTKDQIFELRCLKDWLTKRCQQEVASRQATAIGMRPGRPASDDERNYDHWIETLETILK
jgi:hypothetical protein